MVIDELDVVVLTVGVPERGLRVGDTGTVVLVHGDREAFQVEFCNSLGQAVAMLDLRPHQIRRAAKADVARARSLDHLPLWP